MIYIHYSYYRSGVYSTSRWKVAEVPSKPMRNLYETGFVVGGCQHTIYNAQAAVNMFRGEMYVIYTLSYELCGYADTLDMDIHITCI